MLPPLGLWSENVNHTPVPTTPTVSRTACLPACEKGIGRCSNPACRAAGLKATFTTAYMHTVIIYIVCLVFAFKVYVPGDLLAGIDQARMCWLWLAPRDRKSLEHRPTPHSGVRL